MSKALATTVPRGRARAREVDGIVLEIAGRMTAQRWNEDAATEIAAEHGVSLGTVDEWASDAARMLRLIDEPRLQALRARNVERLDGLYETAKDDRAKVAAVAEQNKLLGLTRDGTVVNVANITAAEWDQYRAALVSELCEGCRTKLLARVRERKDQTK